MDGLIAVKIKSGMKVELQGDPYEVLESEFVKPGKGQAFVRLKLRHLLRKRILEKRYKSAERVPLADVEELKGSLLYLEREEGVFFSDGEELRVEGDVLENVRPWLLEGEIYSLILYKQKVVEVAPPPVLELKVISTEGGVRGNTASGRSLQNALLERGANVQVPLFVEKGEKVKVDTRTATYISKA